MKSQRNGVLPLAQARSIASCRLCAAGNEKSARPEDVTLFQRSGYFGIASIGGFIPGWSLLCSREHQLNMAADMRSGSFHEALQELVDVVSGDYGKCVVFEHGAFSDDSLTSCGTSHAHVHVVPFAGQFGEIVRAADRERDWVSVEMSGLASVVAGQEYLFFSDNYRGAATVGQVALVKRPESQFFRRALAEARECIELADYRKAPLYDATRVTAESLQKAFQARHRMSA